MACAGTIAGIVAGLVLASTEPVVIATDAKPYETYTFVNEAGEIVGFERDLMDEICTRAGLVCSWQSANFDQLIPGVMSGEFDVAIGGIAVTDERRRLVDFTHYYFDDEDESWYVGRPGAPEPAQAMVSVQSGTMHESHLRKMGYRYISFPTEPEVLDALARNDVDLALGAFSDPSDMEDFLVSNGMEYSYYELIPHDGQAIVVCQGNTELLDSLNTALDAIVADGTFATFETRWFN
jgi:polar amino acid transport system substrate-binding protein